MYIHIALLLFFIAVLLVLLSYSPWVQTNLKWMTNFYFYIAVGILLASAILLAAYYIVQGIIPMNK